MDPDIVETLRARGVRCFYGDASHERILEESHTNDAALVILTLPDGGKNELITRTVRHLNPTVPILRVLTHAAIRKVSCTPELHA